MANVYVINDSSLTENVPARNITGEPRNGKRNVRRLMKDIRKLFVERDPEFMETLGLVEEVLKEHETREEDLKEAA
jgi:hypothetical protein